LIILRFLIRTRGERKAQVEETSPLASPEKGKEKKEKVTLNSQNFKIRGGKRKRQGPLIAKKVFVLRTPCLEKGEGRG